MVSPMQLKLGIEALTRMLGVEPADLSSVDDPVGRVDFLISKFVEHGVRGLPPEVQATYAACRPLIDGFIASKAGNVRVKVPDGILEAFIRMNADREAA